MGRRHGEEAWGGGVGRRRGEEAWEEAWEEGGGAHLERAVERLVDDTVGAYLGAGEHDGLVVMLERDAQRRARRVGGLELERLA